KPACQDQARIARPGGHPVSFPGSPKPAHCSGLVLFGTLRGSGLWWRSQEQTGSGLRHRPVGRSDLLLSTARRALEATQTSAPRDTYEPIPAPATLVRRTRQHRELPRRPHDRVAPPPECSRQEGWLYVKPTLPHPISKQGQMNHIIIKIRLREISISLPSGESCQLQKIHPLKSVQSASRDPSWSLHDRNPGRAETEEQLGRCPCEKGQNEHVQPLKYQEGWRSRTKTANTVETAEATTASAWRNQKNGREGRLRRNGKNVEADVNMRRSTTRVVKKERE
ncbi:hypothetical protein LEMLEM_LOCUS6793, partial [Lemmus lemmus]